MRWSRMVIVPVLLLAGGCAQEADDDALGRDRRGTATTGSTESTESTEPSGGDTSDPDRGSVDLDDVLFAPVLNVASAPCDDPSGDLVPDHAGESCYELGPERLDAEVVDSADAELDAAGRWNVALVLTEDGIDSFNGLAALCSPPAPDACPTGQIAILLDGEVLSAPVVQEPSFERDAIVISGEFTEDEATHIATTLTP
jgi:preprotein translocase subunit SecD